MPHPSRDDFLNSIRPVPVESIPAGRETCCICQEDFGSECTPTRLSCGHYVGVDCITTWLGEIDEYGVYKNKCPYNCQLYRRTDAGRPGRPSDVPTGFTRDPRIGELVEYILAHAGPAPPLPRARGDHMGPSDRSHDGGGGGLVRGYGSTPDRFSPAVQRHRERVQDPDYGLDREYLRQIEDLTRLRDQHLIDLHSMSAWLDIVEDQDRSHHGREGRTRSQTPPLSFRQRVTHLFSPGRSSHATPGSLLSTSPLPPDYWPASSREGASNRSASVRRSNGLSRVTGFRDIAGLGQYQDEPPDGVYDTIFGRGLGGHGSRDHDPGHVPRSGINAGGYTLGGRSTGFGSLLERLERHNHQRSWNDDDYDDDPD